MTISMKPLGSRVVIEPIEQEEMTAGGIVLPETAKEKPQKGTVLATGPGDRDEDGDRIKMEAVDHARERYSRDSLRNNTNSRRNNMAKQLVFGDEARRYLKNGVDAVANAVATTLGPKGRNVALDRKYGSPTITHDGVTVAKEIELEDPYENMGAQLLKEAATKTNDIAGDGTRDRHRRSEEPGCRRQPHAAQTRYRSCLQGCF